MTKKIKIKDLEDSTVFHEKRSEEAPKPESKARVRGARKLSIDELEDDEILPKEKKAEVSKNSVSQSIVTPSPEIKTPPKKKDELVYFSRSFFASFLIKIANVFLVFLVLNLVYFLLTYLDGRVINLEDFVSFTLSGSKKWFILKGAGLLILAYFFTNKKDVRILTGGIFCNKTQIVHSVFFSSQEVYLPWTEIKSVRYKFRFFEPYLFFYDEEEVLIGQLEFSLKNKKDFFLRVEKFTGKNHPLVKIQEEISLF